MERVLVVFQATESKTEGLALGFGLGAVEGGANIRLRHLDGSGRVSLQHQGYGRLKPEDIAWAEVIGVGIESSESVEEIHSFLDQVRAQRETDPSAKKLAYVFGGAASADSVVQVKEALSTVGYSLVGDDQPAEEELQHVTAVGRRLAAS
ncbi:MAG TPA: hypothetical protein VGB69_05180 [Edaphobacter sp.]